MGLAARNLVLPGRDLSVEPFRADEERVRGYLTRVSLGLKRAPDPIGALIVWHAALLAEKGIAAETTLPRTNLPVPNARPSLGGDSMRPHAIGTPLHCAPVTGRDPRLPPGRPHP